jgi:hypothetical protein
MAARKRAEIEGLGKGANFAEGHALDLGLAARVPSDCVGRALSRKEAAGVLDRIARATGWVR